MREIEEKKQIYEPLGSKVYNTKKKGKRKGGESQVQCYAEKKETMFHKDSFTTTVAILKFFLRAWQFRK